MRFAVGKIVKPHGLKGALKVYPFTTETERFHEGTVYFCKDRELTLDSAGKIGSNLLLKFKGIDSREDAEALIGEDLTVEEDSLVPLDEGEYYAHQILKCNVFDCNEQLIGTVEELIFLKHGTVMDISRPEGSTIAILFRKDDLKSVDIDKKEIRMLKSIEYYEI